MKIKKGDLVKIICGSVKVKNKIGRIIKMNRKRNIVNVENIMFVKKHVKTQTNSKYPRGGIINKFNMIHISNVMLMSIQDNRPVRIGFNYYQGKKNRVSSCRKVDSKII
jgi:large subunit ribosomal protein L24